MNFIVVCISAVYNWKGDVRSGLPLEIGETVQILEENGGNFVWILAAILSTSSQIIYVDDKYYNYQVFWSF